MTEFKVPVVDAQIRLCVEVSTPDRTRLLPVRALVDTGATQSSIANRVINQLRLEPLAADRAKDAVRGIGGRAQDARRYPIKVRIRAVVMDDQDAGSTSSVAVVASSALGNEQSIDMLLGMDALLRYRSRRGDLDPPGPLTARGGRHHVDVRGDALAS